MRVGRAKARLPCAHARSATRLRDVDLDRRRWFAHPGGIDRTDADVIPPRGDVGGFELRQRGAEPLRKQIE